MVTLPRPPWARRRERCPNCLDRIADDRAAVCDRCGYQLRLPRASLAGIALVVAAFVNFFASVFGGSLFPFPEMPFGLTVPFLESPTPEDLRTVAFWLGAVLVLAGVVAAYAGAYAVRRRGERARAARRGA
jgi:hypothetical protein